MKNILVPTDFSEQSTHAFRTAVEVAARSGGRISFLHVIALPVLHDSPLVTIEGLRKPLIDELTEVAHQKINRLVDTFNTSNVKVDHSVVVSNHIPDAILNEINGKDFDLVIMGTKGASGMREWIFGSNTEKVVRTSPVPVIAVKSFKPGQSIKEIIFPNSLDLDNQEELIMKVKAIQEFFGATLHIVWINTPALFQQDNVVRNRLQAFAKRFMLKNYTINVIDYSDEEAGILAFARQLPGDLIAMGTNGFTGLAHLVSGSIAEDVVNHVEIPVWTFRTRSLKVAAER